MRPRTYRRPINSAEVAAYGRLMNTRPTPKAGDTCSLSGKSVYVLSVQGDLARVLFIHAEQRTATCHVDLLEVAHG